MPDRTDRCNSSDLPELLQTGRDKAFGNGQGVLTGGNMRYRIETV